MNGVVICYGSCIGCHRPFSFNPMKVPSNGAITGKREPICRTCFDAINTYRKSQGQEPFALDPEAYEPCDERELS